MLLCYASVLNYKLPQYLWRDLWMENVGYLKPGRRRAKWAKAQHFPSAVRFSLSLEKSWWHDFMLEFVFARPLTQNRLLGVKALETDFWAAAQEIWVLSVPCCPSTCASVRLGYDTVHKHLHLTFVEGPGSTEYFSGCKYHKRFVF